MTAAVAPSYRHLFEGQRCRLVPVGPEHYEALRYLEAVRLGSWWRSRGALQGPEEWVRRIWEGTAFQALALAPDDGRLLLWMQCYNADPVNAVANLAVARLGETVLTLRAASGLAAFIEYCFNALELRKLYMEVAAPNYPLFASAVGPLFIEEGRLVDHVRGHDGSHDLFLLALPRFQWEISLLREQLLERLGSGDS